LIGYRSLHPIGPDQFTPRAEVANTIGYRRRKGTASVLEQLRVMTRAGTHARLSFSNCWRGHSS
jgi:hypothetical protein